MRSRKLAVLASVSPEGAPEAAMMGIAVTPGLEIIFDTVRSARKYANLLANPRVALVIGGEGEITVQYEGVAEELGGDMLRSYQDVYFGTYPDGCDRLKWPGITYFRVNPRWVRYSNFNENDREITEFEFPANESAASGA